MSKNDFIIYIYKHNLIERWGNKQLVRIPMVLKEDVIQEVYLLLAEYPNDRFDEISKQGFKHLTAWARQFVMNSLTPTGRTRNLINLFKERVEDIEENNYEDNDYEE